VRSKAGTTDSLEVLTNETNSFSAELGLAQAQPNELIALVQLYQALGGGWQQQDTLVLDWLPPGEKAIEALVI
jgi:outer membrane protein, multidrug efflux system